MRQFTPQSFAEFLPKHFQQVSKSAQIAHQAGVGRVKDKAISLVSGHAIYDGHPFSRTRPGGAARLPINIRSGELAKSLRVFKKTGQGQSYFQLQFTSPHAIVTRPGGTALMVDRGFWKELNSFARPHLRQSISRAIRAEQRT